MPEIIRERCELVKLCHINSSGPVFLRHTVCFDVTIARPYDSAKFSHKYSKIWLKADIAKRLRTYVVAFVRMLFLIILSPSS